MPEPVVAVSRWLCLAIFRFAQLAGHLEISDDLLREPRYYVSSVGHLRLHAALAAISHGIQTVRRRVLHMLPALYIAQTLLVFLAIRARWAPFHSAVLLGLCGRIIKPL